MAQIPAVTGTYVQPRATILHAGNTTTSNSVSLGSVETVTRTALTQKTIIQSAFKDTAVTITSVADSGNDDLCKFTLNSHGLSVGDYLQIDGATAKQLNRVHKIVAKDTNTFTTNVPFVTSSTAGDYYPALGKFSKLTARNYIGPFINTSLATIATTIFNFPSPPNDSANKAIMKLESGRRLNITAWSYTTGAATHGSNAGDSYDYAKALNETPIDQAASPSRSVPGELVYLDGDNVPTYGDYSQKNG